MAELVSGFIVPHDPLMASMPDAPPPDKRKRCMDAFATVTRRLASLKVDTVVLIGDDHYTINGPTCIPTAMIAVGDIQGPMEPWLGIPRRQINNNEPLALHIMQHGLSHGVDWAVSKSITLDHSCMVPFHFVVSPLPDVRTIPVYLNSGIEPVIASQRAWDIGQNLGAAIRSWPGPERVAVVGTGGISHWPGMKQMGWVNEAWDHEIMEFTLKGNAAALLAIPDAEILEKGGNGGLEIKNWMCAMAACGPYTGELIAYEAVPEWVAGCGFMQLHLN